MNWAKGIQRIFKVYLASSFLIAAYFMVSNYAEALNSESRATSCVGTDSRGVIKPWCMEFDVPPDEAKRNAAKSAEEYNETLRNSSKNKLLALAIPLGLWGFTALLLFLSWLVIRYILHGFQSK